MKTKTSKRAELALKEQTELVMKIIRSGTENEIIIDNKKYILIPTRKISKEANGYTISQSHIEFYKNE